MPTFQELLDSIKDLKQHQEIRLNLIKEIEQITGRNLIVYAADFTKNFPLLPNSIHWVDKTGFADLIEGLSGESLDILLHSPGGSAEATEQIVEMLRDNFETIRFVIPHSAKSAATLMTLSGNSILMDDRSELGPIDPQILLSGRFVPAQAIIDGFENARKTLINDPKSLPVYLPLLSKYDLNIFEICRNAQNLSKQLAKEWLRTYMLKDREDKDKISEEIAAKLSSHSEFLSHSRSIRIKQAKELGLIIEDLRGMPELRTKFWKLYCAIELYFDRTPAVKLYENTHGVSFAKNVQLLAVRQAEQPPPSAPPAPQPTPPQAPSEG